MIATLYRESTGIKKTVPNPLPNFDLLLYQCIYVYILMWTCIYRHTRTAVPIAWSLHRAPRSFSQCQVLLVLVSAIHTDGVHRLPAGFTGICLPGSSAKLGFWGFLMIWANPAGQLDTASVQLLLSPCLTPLLPSISLLGEQFLSFLMALKFQLFCSCLCPASSNSPSSSLLDERQYHVHLLQLKIPQLRPVCSPPNPSQAARTKKILWKYEICRKSHVLVAQMKICVYIHRVLSGFS